MTICVGVAVFDGIVFAADSAASMVGINPSGQPAIRNVYNGGNKLFNLVRGLPIAAMTCGMGNFGSAPIASMTKDLRKELSAEGSSRYLDPHAYSMKDVVDRVQGYFEEAFDRLDPKPLGSYTFEYWLGGYGSVSNGHEIWKISLANGKFSQPILALPSGECGIVYSGQPEAINRLVMGYSPRFVEALLQAGMNPDMVQPLLQYAQQAANAEMLSAAMPIQDAIDLADFLADVTKRYVRFLPGADTVGGETDIAAVTRHERFKWIKRKHFYPAHLNPLETDHV